MEKKGWSTKKITTEEFISRAKIVHGDKYDYSKVIYTNLHTKVTIICPKHGEFLQYPCDHLKGCGCKECFNEEKRGKTRELTTEIFIKRAKEVHGDKYDYSNAAYKGYNTKICIICPIHGEFWQTPNEHLKGRGCRKCKYKKYAEKVKKDKNIFVSEANKIHNNKYDYTKVIYKNNNTKVCIICPEHGEFWQTPHSHLAGRGCPICKNSHAENDIRSILLENNISFKEHDRKTLGNGLELDFYLPLKQIAIECQGLQHFEPVEHFGGEKDYVERKKNDIKKKEKCEELGISLIYFSDLKNFSFPYPVITNKELLAKTINNGKSI